MKIEYNSENKIFHLTNSKISYVMKIMKNKQIGQLYYGSKLYDTNLENLYYEKELPASVVVYEDDLEFSLMNMRQEYPSYGTTDFSSGAINILQENNSYITNFEYSSHSIEDNANKLKEMPYCFGKAKTLKIKLIDYVINCELTLVYSMFEDSPIIVRSTNLQNIGNHNLIIRNIRSFNLDFDYKDFTMLQLDGSWARERHITTRKIEYGIQRIESQMGTSSHSQNPYIGLYKANANEDSGEVYAFSLLYSGSFVGDVEVGMHDRTRVSMGIHNNNFEWNLSPNEVFETPQAILAYSNCGMNSLTIDLHKFINKHIVNPNFSQKKTPILSNNWEATYFDFDEDKIFEIAKEAAKNGVEMFVLDDGWFGKRNSASTSLGDWFCNLDKIPSGINGLAKKINEELNIKFGLWIEPEMISKDSDLYKKHPEFVIKTPNRKMSYGREQFVLDFTNEKVVECIYKQIDKILSSSNISYIKWDMNRYITEPFSLSLENQGMFMHKYVLGVYKLYDKLTSKYNDIIFESCASGGGRYDLGLLFYAPQTWTSDNTDAYARLKIQFGTSYLYPLRTMAAHVSAPKNHQTGRYTDIKFKGDVAFFGNFGYELDFTELTNEEKNEVSKQINFYNNNYETLIYGDFYRLISPFDKGNITSWMVKDDEHIILGIYMSLFNANDTDKRVYLKGINDSDIYVDSNGNIYSGSHLKYVGIKINAVFQTNNSKAIGSADFTSTIMKFSLKK